MKKILFIMDEAPYSSIQIQEKFDIILTAAAFDQTLALLFLDEGVFQIKQNQQIKEKKKKNNLDLFKLLDLYEVDTFYIEKESLQTHGLTSDNLSLTVEEFHRIDFNKLMQQYDLIL